MYFFLVLIFSVSIILGGDAHAASKKLAQEEPMEESHGEEIRNDQVVSKQELNDFQRQMNDVSKETNTFLKQLKGAKGVGEWVQTLNEMLPKIEACRTKLSRTPADEQRDFMSDCNGNDFWSTLHEMREEFVPPQDIKNAQQDMTRQLKDLSRFKKAVTGKAGMTESSQLIDKIIGQVGIHKEAIAASKGRDQREALNDYWNANIWEEVNKIRSRVELPKEMKNISADMKFVLKDAASRPMEKTYAFFGISKGSVLDILNAKKAIIDEINMLMEQGKYDDAMELVQDDIHQGWHPGDARHLLGMVRETYDRLKNVKDKELKETMLDVVKPILDGFLAKDVRDAKEAMVQFTDEMRKYERFFRPNYNRGSRGLDKNMLKALDKLESLIDQKIQHGDIVEPQDDAQDVHPQAPLESTPLQTP